jgi:ApaG protein
MSYPFVQETNKFRVEVQTFFDFDQSNPMQYQYLFRYKILITNVGEREAQLISRKWNIRDAKGSIKIVEGPGVIGQTPYFKPGQSFEYSSFCPLPTMSGEMWGHFNMMDKDGKEFRIETPIFKFLVPAEYIDIY